VTQVGLLQDSAPGDEPGALSCLWAKGALPFGTFAQLSLIPLLSRAVVQPQPLGLSDIHCAPERHKGIVRRITQGVSVCVARYSWFHTIARAS
jgi:hypothetical protein